MSGAFPPAVQAVAGLSVGDARGQVRAPSAPRLGCFVPPPPGFARVPRTLQPDAGAAVWTRAAGASICIGHLPRTLPVDPTPETFPVPLRDRLRDLIEHRQFRNFILGVILFNAVVLGLETSQVAMARFGPGIRALDVICLAIFVFEIGAKIFVQRGRFFRDGWNLFDFTIVGIALVPAAQGLSVLRALWVLRLFRVISVAPTLRRVVEGLINALPGMASVFLLMGIVFYIGSVIATKLFGAAYPEWFGTLGASAYSLFQIMTLESWSMGIVRPVMETHPFAWVFFVPFILITTFVVVNLVVGLVVNSMQDAHHVEADARTGTYRDEVIARLAEIETLLKERRGR